MVAEDSCVRTAHRQEVAPHGVTRGDRRNGELYGGPPGKGGAGRGLAQLGIAESEPLQLDLGSGQGPPPSDTSVLAD